MNDWVVGVDLGGTKIEIDLVNPQNKIVGRRRIPTNPWEGPASVVERIAGQVRELENLLPAGERIAAMGICSPGPVDHETGTLIDPPNLAGLHHTPFRQLLAERLNIVVELEHDAKAAGLGEYYYGAGRGEPSMVYVVVGTGVGGAIIADGKLLRGPDNSAGEIGHITYDARGDLCPCGSRGCVETFVSGPWLTKYYQRFLDEENQDFTPGVYPTLTGEQVVVLAGQGDPVACRVMDQAGEALGMAIATMAMLLNIDLYVLGGSVAKSGEVLLERTRQAIFRHAYRSVSCGVEVIASELGDDGPILGCAWIARQALAAHRQPEIISRSSKLPASERARLEQVEGMVFDVQRFSVHDGPGIRTNVFMKGCPLRCPWCANPEGQQSQAQLMLSAQNCPGCDQAAELCTVDWGLGGWTQATNDKFGQRVAQCPTGALRWVGQRRSAGDILGEVERDLPFYEGVGGLTLTGGEPTFQPRLAEALLRLAKDDGLSTAMETTGHTRWKILERLLPYLDLVLFDLKHLDPAIHKQFTGVDNEMLLANLRRLAALHMPVTVRVPLIPGFNATEENVRATAEFVRQLDGLTSALELLPYHTLGHAKYKALGRPNPWADQPRLTDAQIATFRQIAEACGVVVTVGGL